MRQSPCAPPPARSALLTRTALARLKVMAQKGRLKALQRMPPACSQRCRASCGPQGRSLCGCCQRTRLPLSACSSCWI